MSIVSVNGLFETHLTVIDLQRSMIFFEEVLGLELAQLLPERKVAFYWIGSQTQFHAGAMGGREWPSADEPSSCLQNEPP